jgi:hypothetical protein
VEGGWKAGSYRVTCCGKFTGTQSTKKWKKKGQVGGEKKEDRGEGKISSDTNP